MNPWIFGGSGRCGKTSMVLALNGKEGKIIGFQLEGLFAAYSEKYPVVFSNRIKKILITQYLQRPRYVDVERLKSKKPIAFFTTPLDDILNSIEFNSNNIVPIIASTLDIFAKDNNCETWAAYDLLPEFYFHRFLKYRLKINFATMLRDPRESIAAMLHWRCYPKPPENRDIRFKHSLIIWCLSIQTGLHLRKKYPKNFKVFSFNRIINNDNDEINRISKDIGVSSSLIKEYFSFEPFFTFDSFKGHKTPQGGWDNKLLTQLEYYQIDQLCKPFLREVENSLMPKTEVQIVKKLNGFIIFSKVVLLIGKLSPRFAKLIVDMRYFPKRRVFRFINISLDFFKNLLNLIIK
jgi:hypothetical protein